MEEFAMEREKAPIDIRDFGEMENAFLLADSIVTKNYLANLSEGEVLKTTEELKTLDVSKYASLFQIKKIVYNKEENNLQKLINTYASMVGFGSNIVMILDSNAKEVSLYLGTTGGNSIDETRARAQALWKSFYGNFPGSLPADDNILLENDQLNALMAKCIQPYTCVSSVSGVGSVREKDDVKNENFIQGIEKLIDTMQGANFSAIFIANVLDGGRLADIRAEYEVLYSKLAPFEKSELSFNESTADGISKTLSESLSNTVTESKSSALSAGTTKNTTHTEGHAVTHTDTVGIGASIGKNSGTSTSYSEANSITGSVGIGIGKVANAGVAVGKTVAQGVAHMIGMSLSGSVNYSHGIARTKSMSDATSFGTTNTTTDTSGHSKAQGTTHGTSDGKSHTDTSGKGIQLTYVNKSVENLLKRIDEQLERLKEGENYGIFAAAAYFLAKDPATARMAASMYKGLMNGNCTHVECANINLWQETESVNLIKSYLAKLQHPSFSFENGNEVTPVSIVSGRELAVQMGLPRKSFPGVSVIETAAFGRNIERTGDKKTGNPSIQLGNLYHMGREEEGIKGKIPVKLDLNSLTMHTFITGSTGAGKSNAIYSLIESILKRNGDIEEEEAGDKISFMVIEPAKGEYKDKFGHYEDVSVYGTNKKKMNLLRINPFSFPDDVHVLEHIDRLIEIFNVCWPMYAAMPAVLKDAIERSYINAGWNLTESVCKYADKFGKNVYPNFVDVLKMINIVMEESKYSADSKGDYTGALCTRVKSLTNGIYGQIFTNNELSSQELFDSNVIIDLSRVGSIETKSLLMGLLIMKMQEYRMSSHTGSNSQLRHLTVLEEAHNLLKRTSPEQSSESSNLLGKSVEMLANSIAEMRTYGEGFIIADQAPGLLDMAVIRNTNTKIILRLPDISDRELVGKAASLTDNQIQELSKLQTGVAAIYQNDWLEPVLCKISRCRDDEQKYESKEENITLDEERIKKELIQCIMLPAPEKLDLDTDRILQLEKMTLQLGIATSTKLLILDYFKEKDPDRIQNLRSRIVYSMFNSETALLLSNVERNDINSWQNVMLENLEPNIELFDIEEQNKILAIIAKEHNDNIQTKEAEQLMNNVLQYLDKHI